MSILSRKLNCRNAVIIVGLFRSNRPIVKPEHDILGIHAGHFAARCAIADRTGNILGRGSDGPASQMPEFIHY